MSEGQSQRSVALSMQHRQEAEVAAAEERERAMAETAATAARAELAAARAEVETAAVTDAARATATGLETLRASSTGSSVSADDDRDNELKLGREAAREQTTQWAAAHPQGCHGGSPDRHGRAGGWVDGDRDRYSQRGSPFPDRSHGHHGIQAIVRDVGPGGEWPTLTKANYVEWATVMRVRL
jgi:hypothetical protein